MTAIVHRLLVFSTQIFFTLALAPLFLLPHLTTARWMRTLIASAFGRRLSKRYHKIIAFYGDSYGTALRQALERATQVGSNAVRQTIDCGTGTGFAAAEITRRFPDASLVGLDRVPEMLRLARQRFEGLDCRFREVLADSFQTPFGDGSMDLVVSQNSVPFLKEYARICRPGSCVIFVDTAARWIYPLAGWAARRTGAFDLVIAERAGIGFFLLARRAGRDGQAPTEAA